MISWQSSLFCVFHFGPQSFGVYNVWFIWTQVQKRFRDRSIWVFLVSSSITAHSRGSFNPPSREQADHPVGDICLKWRIILWDMSLKNAEPPCVGHILNVESSPAAWMMVGRRGCTCRGEPANASRRLEAASGGSPKVRHIHFRALYYKILDFLVRSSHFYH